MAGPFQKVQTDELCCYGCGLQTQYVEFPDFDPNLITNLEVMMSKVVVE